MSDLAPERDEHHAGGAMKTRWIATAVVASSLFVGLAPRPVAAQQGYLPPAADAQAAQLYQLGKEKRSLVSVTGGKVPAGRAEIFVNAPVSTVRAAVLDYGNYATVIPRFSRAKVLKKNGLGADVYLQIPILHGAATIWTVQRFAPPVTTGALETVAGTSVQGNVEDLRTKWTYRAVDAQHSVLSCEIYVVPKIPVPGDQIGGESQRAAAEAVVSVKAHSERVAKQVAKSP